MSRFEALGRQLLDGSVLVVVALCLLGTPGTARAQITQTITNPPTPCLDYIKKYYFPSGPTGATNIIIKKDLTVSAPTCTIAGSNSAFCSVNGMIDLIGSATGTQITMSPSCNFNCGACGTITINSSDGLPVELMDFEVLDGDEADSESREADEADTGDKKEDTHPAAKKKPAGA